MNPHPSYWSQTSPDHIGVLIKALYRLLSNPITGLTLLWTFTQTNQITSFHRVSPVTQSHHPGGLVGEGRGGSVQAAAPPSSHLAPINNHARVVLWYLRRKQLCEHPISNQQNQHNLSQWIIPKPPLPPPPTPLPSLPHHMLVCSTTLFTFLLANYLPLSPVCLGAGRSVIGGISAIL